MKVYGGMETYLDSALNAVLGMTSGHFHATPLYPRGKSPHFRLHLKLSGPQFREGMNFLSVKEFESQFLGHPARKLLTIFATLCWFPDTSCRPNW